MVDGLMTCVGESETSKNLDQLHCARENIEARSTAVPSTRRRHDDDDDDGDDLHTGDKGKVSCDDDADDRRRHDSLVGHRDGQGADHQLVGDRIQERAQQRRASKALGDVSVCEVADARDHETRQSIFGPVYKHDELGRDGVGDGRETC